LIHFNSLQQKQVKLSITKRLLQKQQESFLQYSQTLENHSSTTLSLHHLLFKIQIS